MTRRVRKHSTGICHACTRDAYSNPRRLYFTDGSQTRYTYSAMGEKLLVEHYVASPNVTVPFGAEPDALTQGQVIYAGSTQYLLGGSLVMKDGLIDSYLFDGGYAKATFVNPTTYTFEFYYYNKDHLGNNREVVDSAGTVMQITHYYPFGTPYADPSTILNASIQPYKYNGKELDRMHGLDTYDYGARQYDPVLGRWDRVDPLCEKYYDISPYAYCANNPVRYIDPDGRKVVFVNGYLGFGSPEGGAIYWNGSNSSFVKNAQSTFKDYTTPFFTNYDYNYWESASILRESQGYQYAKQNYNALIEDMEPGVDKFNFVSHSMGGAFSEGMIRYLSEEGWEIENAVFLNSWEPAQIKTKVENTRIDATGTNDPVQKLSKPAFGEPDIPLSDKTIRIKSEESIWYIHRDLIDGNSNNLWNLIKDLLKE